MKIIIMLKRSDRDSFIFMKIDKNSAFYIIASVTLIVLFVFLQPKALPFLFGIRNRSMLDSFITHTVKTKKVDVQEFWKMREFYCPGSFTYDKTRNPFLIYDCKWLHSEDYLSTETRINSTDIKKTNIVLQTETTLIYKDSNKIHIKFLASPENMKKAVGVFDYAEKDKKLVENKNWIDITTISQK